MPQGLGNADVQATIGSPSGTNPGNWTATFSPQVIGISYAEYEAYRIVIRNGPPGSKFDVFIGTRLYDSVSPGDTNSWDPNQTMKLIQGDTIEFRWNTGAGDVGPEVWMYFQEAGVL
jgi:hypothetical protein